MFVTMKGVFCFQWLTMNLTNSFLFCEEERNWFHCLIGCIGFKFWNNSVLDPLLVLFAFLKEWSRYTSIAESILLEFPSRLRTVCKSICDISPMSSLMFLFFDQVLFHLIQLLFHHQFTFLDHLFFLRFVAMLIWMFFPALP